MISQNIQKNYVKLFYKMVLREEYLYVVLVLVCLLLQIGLSEYEQLSFIVLRLQRLAVVTIMQMLPVSEQEQ